MPSPESVSEGKHFEVIDSVELARRWVLPVSWVREHVGSRGTDPIPHTRFGRCVRFRSGGPELKAGLRAHGQFRRVSQTNPTTLIGGHELRPPLQINRLSLIERHGFIDAHLPPQ